MTPRTVAEIDWAAWKPDWRATLLFVCRDRDVLLIHKKTGFGRGKINAPGGRIEAGETPYDAAVREVREEVLVTPIGAYRCGELFFQFLDGFTIHGVVYRADDFEGEPAETEEARPFWNATDAMPYDRMWPDDACWVPHVFARRSFVGRFVFDGETMLDHVVEADAPGRGP